MSMAGHTLAIADNASDPAWDSIFVLAEFVQDVGEEWLCQFLTKLVTRFTPEKIRAADQIEELIEMVEIQLVEMGREPIIDKEETLYQQIEQALDDKNEELYQQKLAELRGFQDDEAKQLKRRLEAKRHLPPGAGYAAIAMARNLLQDVRDENTTETDSTSK